MASINQFIADDYPFHNLATNKWQWLFPFIYLIHISEEFWGGEGYIHRLLRTKGVVMTPGYFLALTGVACILIIAAVWLATTIKRLQWTLVVVAAALAANGVSHTITGVRTGEYHPGLITGLLLWLPFGIAAIWWLRSFMSKRTYWTSIIIGGGIQFVIPQLVKLGGQLATLTK